MRVFLLLILFWTGLVSTTRAQAGHIPMEIPRFHLVSHPFMPPVTSEYIFFSKDNLVWFSTGNGLASFDGSEVVIHSTLTESNQYGLNRIQAMTEDADHNFYLATAMGVFFFDREKKEYHQIRLSFNDPKPTGIIYCSALLYDQNGLLFIGSSTHGFFIYNTRTKRLKHYNLLPGKQDTWEDYRLNTVRSFGEHYSDPSKIWLGTFNGICLYDKQQEAISRNFTVVNPAHYVLPKGTLVAYDIEKMDVADDSTIWFSCWTYGFGWYHTRTGQAKLFLYDAKLNRPDRNIGFVITRFARYATGKYILGIYDGPTALFDAKTEKATYFNVSGRPYEIEQNRYVSRDRQGNVWVLQKGLLYVSIPDHLLLKSREIGHADRINLPQLRNMFYDTATGHYIGAYYAGNGAGIYDSQFNLIRKIRAPQENNYYTYNSTPLNKVVSDRNRAYWALGDNLYWCAKGSEAFMPASKKFPELSGITGGSDITDLQVSRTGKILYRKNSSLIYLIDPDIGGRDSIMINTRAVKEVEIKAATGWYDPGRDLVYLSQRSAIIQYDLGTKKQREVPLSALFGSLPPDQGVCVAALDQSGGIWFLIPKFGLRLIDPGSLRCKDSVAFGQRGLIRGDYTSLTGGEQDRLVFRSLNGIVVYDFKRRTSYLFDRGNDLTSPEVKAMYCCNGYLFISHMGSFQYYRLSDLSKYELPLQPVLNSIVADTQQVYIRTGEDTTVDISLPYYRRSLRFSFSAPEFFFPERIEYAYQLEGVDHDWKYTSTRDRIVSYSNLKPGNYTFRLKAQRWGGNWEVEVREYTIRILPAFWQQSWFESSVFLAAALLLVMLIVWRDRYVKKREAQRLAHEKELSELEAKALRAQMNPHFIFNCLNSIKVLIQDKENEKGIIYLTTFSKLIRTLFNNADKKEITLYDEIETCKYYLQLESMRFDSQFSYSIQVDPSIDLKSVTVPALVIQPFIENAIWHGIMPRNTGGSVVLNIRHTGDAVEVEIDDDGIGREASRRNKAATGVEHHSKGVSLTEARLKLSSILNQRDAHITIIDKKDMHDVPLGTKILITFKEE